jgi:hypothetical protein
MRRLERSTGCHMMPIPLPERRFWGVVVYEIFQLLTPDADGRDFDGLGLGTKHRGKADLRSNQISVVAIKPRVGIHLADQIFLSRPLVVIFWVNSSLL